MRNIFNLSVMILATACMTACNQNEEPAAISESESNLLTVTATANNFTPADAETRATETGLATTFAEGDQIGVYAISEEGEVIIKNRKLTKNASGEWEGTLYYYKNADYVAYFPYTEELSTKEIGSLGDITTYFSARLSTGQGSKEAYYANDVMAAVVEAAEVTKNSTVNFNFEHQFSMIQVTIPARSYETTGGFEYSAPLNVELTINNEKYTPYSSAKGSYRCLVKPTAENETYKVEGTFYDGDAPVSFEKSDIALAANAYKGLNVSYTYDNYNATRDLQVGDYFYADGSIYPGDLSNPLSAGCVGIIYSTTTTDAEKNDGFTHGQVIALNDANVASCAWGTIVNEVAQYKTNRTNSSTTTDSNDENVDILNNMFNDKDGYTLTKKVQALDSYNQSNYPAIYYATAYGDVENTTGWYLPTMGQMADMLNAFSVRSGSSYKFGPTNNDRGTVWNAPAGDEPTIQAMLNLYEQLVAVGGTWNIDRPDKNGDHTKGLRWWINAGYDAGNAWCIDMSCLKFVALVRGNSATNNNTFVRPFLAF